MTTSINTKDLTQDQVQELTSGESYIIIGQGTESDDCQILDEEVAAWYTEYVQSDLIYRFSLEDLINEVRHEGCNANSEEGSAIYVLSKEEVGKVKNVIREKLKAYYVEEADTSYQVEEYKEAILAKIEECGEHREAVIDVMNETFNEYAGKLWYFGLEMPNDGLDSVMPRSVEDFIEAMADLKLAHLGTPGYAEGEGQAWKLY